MDRIDKINELIESIHSLEERLYAEEANKIPKNLKAYLNKKQRYNEFIKNE